MHPSVSSIDFHLLLQTLHNTKIGCQHVILETYHWRKNYLHDLLHKICLPELEFFVHFKGLWSKRDKDDLSFFFFFSLTFYFWDLPDFSDIDAYLTTKNLSNMRDVVKRSLPKLPCRQSKALRSTTFIKHS